MPYVSCRELREGGVAGAGGDPCLLSMATSMPIPQESPACRTLEGLRQYGQEYDESKGTLLSGLGEVEDLCALGRFVGARITLALGEYYVWSVEG